MTRDKIYIVEDDEAIRELVVYTLGASGYEATGFGEAASFYAAVQNGVPSLVLLDIMLPGEDGIAILKKLRLQPATNRLPVIMLTAKSAEYDKVLGLDAGADDYIAKPFGMMELLSRVRAVLRRAQGPTAPADEKVLRLGGIEVNPLQHTVLAQGTGVPLTLKEYDLLLVLLCSPGRVFSREYLLQEVWGYEYEGETRTVDVHIRTLRQKLGPCAGQVETVRGVGYRAVERAEGTP